MSYDFGWRDMSHGIGGCWQEPSWVTVELDGIEMVDTARRGGSHTASGFYLQEWEGWHNGADAVGGPLSYESADGGYETPVYMSGRSISLAGVIVGQDRSERDRMVDQLSKVCVANRWTDLVVSEDALGLSRQIRVCRLRAPQITPAGRNGATFTVELKSASFPKLGTVLQSSGPLGNQGVSHLVNEGDYPADLYATITAGTAPMVNPTIYFPGGMWRYAGTVPAGEVRTVDFAQRAVRNPANRRSFRMYAGGDWPTVEPGSNRFVAAMTSGGGTIELTWRSAWM